MNGVALTVLFVNEELAAVGSDSDYHKKLDTAYQSLKASILTNSGDSESVKAAIAGVEDRQSQNPAHVVVLANDLERSEVALNPVVREEANRVGRVVLDDHPDLSREQSLASVGLRVLDLEARLHSQVTYTHRASVSSTLADGILDWLRGS